MAPINISSEVTEVIKEESQLPQTAPGGPPEEPLIERISHEIFKYDCLDRRLKRHHITGASLPIE